MTSIREDAVTLGVSKAQVKSLTPSVLAQSKSKRNQSEVVAKAFAVASKRTGTFASKYAK